MTAYELMEITLGLRAEAQGQFEYWLTISFALIAASFVGKKYLKPSTAVALGAIYLLTVLMLTARYFVVVRNIALYNDEAIVQGAPWISAGSWIFALRLAVFLCGTLAALWFLYSNSKNREGDT